MSKCPQTLRVRWSPGENRAVFAGYVNPVSVYIFGTEVARKLLHVLLLKCRIVPEGIEWRRTELLRMH